MDAHSLGKSSNELFCQFLFRMLEVADEVGLKDGQLVIATFNNPTWMSGSSFTAIRKFIQSKASFNAGFIFEASEFDGCSGGWPISFAVFENTPTKDEKFLHDCYESDELGLDVEQVGTKEFYNPDGCIRLDEWCRLEVKQTKPKPTDTLAYIWLSAGMSQNNFTQIRTQIPYRGHNVPIIPENFDKMCEVYACRTLIQGNWLNEKDNYFAPNEQHPLFDTFVRDARVYSIFSYQTSVAGDIDGEHYDYINSFCPFTKKEVLELRGEHVPSMMPDESRFIRSSGKLDNLTPEAQLVLDLYKEAIKAVAPELDEWDYQHPELQLTRWDAGWRQYRDLIKEKAPEANQKLRDAIKALGNKLRPMVYELGFLKK